MNIVIPMAGRGSRFLEVGQTVPKPCIDVLGKPMYAWATESLPLTLATKIIFICQNEHMRIYGLKEDIHLRFGKYQPEVIGIDGVTEGQLCTVLLAREWINDDVGLMIYNADTYCKTDIGDMLNIPENTQNIDGILGVFKAEGSKWSFAKLDDAGRVIETAEKTRISNLACTGLYYFRNGRDFVRMADEMIANSERTNSEFYVAPLYNKLIAKGGYVTVDHAKEVWNLGTPDDLNAFLMAFTSAQTNVETRP